MMTPLRSSVCCLGFQLAPTQQHHTRALRRGRQIGFARHITRRLGHSNNSDNHDNNNIPRTAATTMITSKSSTTIKRIRSLLNSRKKRLQLGLTVVEGPRSVLDLLCAKPALVQQVLLRARDASVSASASASTTSTYDKSNNNNNQRLWQILDELPTTQVAAPQILTVEGSIFDSLADTVTPQGILAVVKIPNHDNRDNKINNQMESSSSSLPSPLVLVLDGVADPGNVGTLLRSAVATGVPAVIMLPGTTDPYSPKALRSSMACVFNIPLVQSCNSWDEAVTLLQSWVSNHDDNSNNNSDNNSDNSDTVTPHLHIYAATMMDDLPGTCHYDVDWTQQRDKTNNNTALSCIIIGNEGTGLSEPVRQAVRDGTIQSVYVPMVPNSVESLNAGVCGSVIMFEYLRQVQTKDAARTEKQQRQNNNNNYDNSSNVK